MFFKSSSLPIAALCLLLAHQSPAQDKPEPAKAENTKKRKLPADLAESKLLFIKFVPVDLPAKRPKDMDRRLYKLRERHNEIIGESNKQLREAASHYPFAYRITTLDSIDYYNEHGYQYMLMHNSFNAGVDGSFRGTSSRGSGTNQTMTTTTVNLYLQELRTGRKFIFDDFSETFIYYYKGQVGMLLKKVKKEFNIQKS